MRWKTGDVSQISRNGRSRTFPAVHGTEMHGKTSPRAEMAQLPRAQLHGKCSGAVERGRRLTRSRSGPR